MPPSAATAARRPAARRAGGSRVHRRVSGPARPARTARATAPPIPRRLQAAAPALGPFAERALHAARTLRDSNAVDRLVRGRIWIGLLMALLIGLVALNVSLLKLNAAAGRNAEWAKKLRIENADLRARVSHLHSAEQIQAEGRKLGLVMPAAADVHYLIANPARDAARAAHRQSLIAPWSNSDLVSASPDPASVAPTVPAAPAPTAAPAAGTIGVQAATGPANSSAPASVAPTGTTGQAGTGAGTTTVQPYQQATTGAATP
jgi:hypothetical protein